MFHFYVLSFFEKGDTIQGGTLFKGGQYLRKYSISTSEKNNFPGNYSMGYTIQGRTIFKEIQYFSKE